MAENDAVETDFDWFANTRSVLVVNTEFGKCLISREIEAKGGEAIEAEVASFIAAASRRERRVHATEPDAPIRKRSTDKPQP